MALSFQSDYSTTASDSEDDDQRRRPNRRFVVREGKRRAPAHESRQYRSLSKRKGGGGDSDSSDGDSGAPSRPRRPPARSRSNGPLIAGGVVVLVLFTLGGLALISYYSNKYTYPSSTATTASPTSLKAEATPSFPPTSPSIKGPTATSKIVTEPKASSTSYEATDGPSASTTASATDSASSSTSTSSSDGDLSLLTTLGVTGFLGENSGIGSWFRTDSSQDSTNGNSWCGCPYNDSVPGFAPSVGTMLSNFNNVYEDAGKAYCGLEARFTAPNGNTELLVIGDGFDDKWVLTPSSVDIIWGSFGKLYGSETTDKNDVIKDLKWEFTGVQRKEYIFEVCR